MRQEEKLKEINAAHDYLSATSRVEESARPQPVASRKLNLMDEFEEAPAPRFHSDGILGRRRVGRSTTDHEANEQAIASEDGRQSDCSLITGAVALIGLLVFSTDFLPLIENSTTSRGYDQFKAEIAQDLRAKGILSSNAPGAQGSKDANAEQAPEPNAVAAAPAGSPPAKADLSGGHSAAKATNGVKPYVTSGLTPTEVLSILGSPTSSSGEKMFYKGSEIDFRNGQVAGWKIDPNTAPIRVKLWPSAAPVPGVTTFAVGSSKSDVIAVQGTPTLFSDSQFGYGKSLVFFQNDKVVGWKEDPGSVRLRAVAH